MTAEPDNPQSDQAYWSRALGYGWLLALVGLTGPVATAAVLAAMLRSVGAAAEQLGSTLSIGVMPPQAVTPWWTAMPVVVIGGALILATAAPLAKHVKGLTFLAVNAWLVDLLVLGMAVQLPPGSDGLDSPLLRSLSYAFPLLMLLVLAVSVLYFRGRIVPEPAAGFVGHARERLAAAETGGSDG